MTANRGPGFLAKGVVDHAGEGLVRCGGFSGLKWNLPVLEGDGNTRVGNLVGVIDRAIDGIDDPAEGSGVIAGGSLFAEEGDLREGLAQPPGDLALTTDVQLQFQVMRLGFIDLLGSSPMLAQEPACGLGGFDGNRQGVARFE